MMGLSLKPNESADLVQYNVFITDNRRTHISSKNIEFKNIDITLQWKMIGCWVNKLGFF